MATGWRLTRSSATTAALVVANGAAATLPASFFATQSFASGVTVTTLGTGVITITTAGWYELNAAILCQIPVIATSGGVVGLIESPWAVAVNGGQVGGTLQPGNPADVFLNVNDTVQPMVSAAGEMQSDAGPLASQTANNIAAGQVWNINAVLGFSSWSGRLLK